MGLSAASFRFANGLGERFADEYFQSGEDSRDDVFRGVLCYLWESFATATDPFLKVNIAFAAPPLEGGGPRRIFLAALHMGRSAPSHAPPSRSLRPPPRPSRGLVEPPPATR